MPVRTNQSGLWARSASRSARLGRAAVLAVAGMLCAAGPARAGFTTVNAPPTAPVNEATFTQIFDHVYGSTFTLTNNAVDYTNGTVTAHRVPDTLPGTSSTGLNPGPNATDQVWTGTTQNVTAKAVWAGWAGTFGYYPGTTGGAFTPLFTATGTETFSVTGSANSPSLPATFRWGENTPVGTTSSQNSDNFDGKDHMVTYQITGLGGNYATYLLFLEDRGNTGTNPDFDFQDLVVQLQIAPASAVPEPGTMMVLAGASLLLLKRARPFTRA